MFSGWIFIIGISRIGLVMALLRNSAIEVDCFTISWHEAGRKPLILPVRHLVLVITAFEFQQQVPRGRFCRHTRVQINEPAPNGRQFLGDHAAQSP